MLRDGRDRSRPSESQRLWAEYLQVDKILAETIKAGPALLARSSRNYTRDGSMKRRDRRPRQPAAHGPPQERLRRLCGRASTPDKTHHLHRLSWPDEGCSRPWSDETYFGPRIGSLGPGLVRRTYRCRDNHHFVIEYFFYMPSPGDEGEESVPALVGSRGGHRDGERYRVFVSSPGRSFYLIGTTP